MKKKTGDKKKILVLYFSLSSQTKNILYALIKGLKSSDIDVTIERLEPVQKLRFPLGSIYDTIKMMVLTFFRMRIPIKSISVKCFEDYDLIVLAGPTWSYNPCGPILFLFDSEGQKLFKGKKVLPVISCRGYWRVHWYGLRKLLFRCGAEVKNLIVFSHPSAEPWRTIGVFLKLAGRNPEKKTWINKFYKKYGHTRNQLREAHRFGVILGEAIGKEVDIQSLSFKTDISLP
jgi:hypothetical protein